MYNIIFKINFSDDTGILISFGNTKLVTPETEGIVKVIADIFFSNSEVNDKVKIYMQDEFLAFFYVL